MDIKPSAGFYKENSITAFLNCPICDKKVKENKMCPSCSTLYCKACIYSHLDESIYRCLGCNKFLRKESLVECRFIGNIYEALDLTKPKPCKTEKCPHHSVDLIYYCLSCQKAVCSDCAMISSEHKNHEFGRLNEVYDIHVQLIEAESIIVQKKIEDFKEILSKINSDIESVQKNKEEESEDLAAILQKIQARLDAQLEEKLQSLYQAKDKLYDEINYLENFLAKIEQEISQTPKATIINKAQDILDSIKKVQLTQLEKIVNTSSIEFYSELVPEYTSSNFILKDFKTAKKDREIVYSEPLNVNGVVWRLKVYPDGNGIAKGNYISVFLELVKGSKGTVKYDYKIEMINHIDSSLVMEREFTSDFEVGECWGYNRFFRLDLIEEEGYIDPLGTLVLNFYIRPSGFKQATEDQKKIINALEKKNTASESLLKKLTEQVQVFENANKISSGLSYLASLSEIISNENFGMELDNSSESVAGRSDNCANSEDLETN